MAGTCFLFSLRLNAAGSCTVKGDPLYTPPTRTLSAVHECLVKSFFSDSQSVDFYSRRV